MPTGVFSKQKLNSLKSLERPHDFKNKIVSNIDDFLGTGVGYFEWCAILDTDGNIPISLFMEKINLHMKKTDSEKKIYEALNK